MNYLELVKATMLLIRAGQSPLESPLDTVDGATGLNFEIASYVAMALRAIEIENPRWKWMIRNQTLIVPAGTDMVDPEAIDGFDEVVLDGVPGNHSIQWFTELDSSDARRVSYIPWESFNASLFGLLRSDGAPTTFSIDPSEQIVLSAKSPQQAFLGVRYRRKPQLLLTDNDVPEMPERHHMAIVWWAIARLYCVTRDADSLMKKADRELNRGMQKMRNSQIDDVFVGEH